MNKGRALLGIIAITVAAFTGTPAAQAQHLAPPDCTRDWVCWKNFANCETADTSSGKVSAVVYHRQSSSGASTQVWEMDFNNASSMGQKVGQIRKASGGGGTIYWTIEDPLSGAVIPVGEFDVFRPDGVGWASFSVNPVVRTLFYAPNATGPMTVCNVALNKTIRYYN